jgi:hypothetical protein
MVVHALGSWLGLPGAAQRRAYSQVSGFNASA